MVGLDLIIGRNAPDGHRQRQLDCVARFPIAIQARVALLSLRGSGLPLILRRDRFIDFVLEAVEIAQDGLCSRPAGKRAR